MIHSSSWPAAVISTDQQSRYILSIVAKFSNIEIEIVGLSDSFRSV